MPRRKKTPSPPSASGPRDFVRIAIDYAQEACADVGRQKFGKWIRKAAQRFLDDLERAGKPGAPFLFDEWHACDPCRFLEALPHVEGVWDTPNIVLHPAHVFATVQLFGFLKPDGTRRFSTALFAIARKNAKSTWAAGIGLYCECREDELGGQVISAATTGAQARIVFRIAKLMTDRSADLRTAFALEPFANSIVCMANGGTFKPINAKASTQDGLNPSCTIVDEVHAHPDGDLLNVLQSAAGARRNPLTLYTTTEGYETPGPWPELRHFAQQILDGIVEADHFLALIWALDDEEGKEGTPGYVPADDDFDESKWEKANPLMSVNPILVSEIRKSAVEARAMPGRLAEFRIKKLNRKAVAANAWIDLARWRACGGAVNLEALTKIPCWGGLDLASTRDISALRLVWRVGPLFLTHGWRWVPDNMVTQRTTRGTVRYDPWIQAGLIKVTPGNVTDYAVIEADILDLTKRFHVEQIAFDRWNAVDLCNRLVEKNVPMIEFIQGPKSYHPAMQAVECAYVEGNLAHGGDPVLTWCASNLIARQDVNNNMAPDKKRAPDKIDDMVAFLMAMGLAVSTPAAKPSVYESRGVLRVG